MGSTQVHKNHRVLLLVYTSTIYTVPFGVTNSSTVYKSPIRDNCLTLGAIKESGSGEFLQLRSRALSFSQPAFFLLSENRFLGSKISNRGRVGARAPALVVVLWPTV